VADELVKVGIIAEDKTGPGVASAKRNLDSLGKGAASATSSFNGLKAAAIGVGGALAVVGGSAVIGGLTNMAGRAVQSYAAYERLGQSINALTAKQALLSGSATTMTQALAQTKTQSKELLGWIEKLAIESPFKQDDVAQAFRLAMALGFSTKESQRLTGAMLNFATATGAGGETIERVNRALGQMKTKGKVSLEEINQLTEGGVDAMRILRDATGKTGEALYKDISKGAISADFAIEAIIADTEKLYAGAGKASAGSFAGMLSSLEEVQDIVGRTLFTGMFEQLAGPMAALTSIVTAPEFKAGLEDWSATLGSFTGDQIEGAAAAMERIDAAISPLLNAGAPAWMVALQGLAAASGSDFKITVTPEVTKVKLPEAGLGVEVTATATKLELGAGLPPLQISADITPESAAVIESVLKAAGEGGAKGFGYELGVQSRLALQKQAGELGPTFAAWGEQAKSNLDASLSTWQPVIGVTGTWINDTPAKLFAMAAQPFTEPIMMAASWLPGAISGLWDAAQSWFSANSVTLNVQTSYTGDTQPLGLPAGTTLPNDITPPMPSYSGDPRYAPVGGSTWNSPATSSTGGPPPKRNRAIGDGFFRGGLALVGEQGPELAVFPRGTAIYNNRDTKAMYGGGVPHFAAGTTQLPPGAGPIIGLLRSMGLWKSTGSSSAMGPKTEAESVGWRDFTQQGTEAMQTAADRTGAAFEETAAKVNKTFESALQGVPGLFGTSQVTGDQMRMAEMGVPQNFADDYVRRLSDEVLNGVDWEGVDIGDAAKRAGIDPNLPSEVILELFKNAWNDSSLFANAANTDLINMDAVKAAIEQQQKELAGQANIKALFGITDENLQQQSEQLGQGLAAVFGGASDSDAIKGAGAALFEGAMTGMGDTSVASKGIATMADSMKTAIGTPENQSALYDNGYAAYAPWAKGFAAAAAAAPITPPGGGSGGSATPPGGKAIGVGFWQGGWMTVHANETLYAPRGTTVRNARESARDGRGMTVINNVTINRQIDEAAFMAKMARQLRRAS
jgi:tape measure domain-containing protein